MRNIELKARLHDWRAAVAACESAGAVLQGSFSQTDTYFRVRHGRLKLRRAEPGESQLIFYDRPDETGARGSYYLLTPVPVDAEALLAAALGVLAVVRKQRTLYLWQNVRIHLDRVESLGDFVEFEAVLSGRADRRSAEEDTGTASLAHLRGLFGIRDADLVACSYADLAIEMGGCPG